MEDKLKEISITDELTGLLNRRGFLFVAEKQITPKNAQPDRRYTFSMSTGIAQYDEDNPCSLEEFISMDDKAMYQSKREKKSKYSATAPRKAIRLSHVANYATPACLLP